MKRTIMMLLVAIVYFDAFAQAQDSASIFDQFNQFLVKEVVFGMVDYGALAKDPSELNHLVRLIAEYDLNGTSEDHKTAFYINAYNILVIKQITDNYPVKSPMDIEGFFKVKTFNVAGEILTLDAIEFTKLFGRTHDPRIHFALGCGARSCPFLYDNAFYPAKLQEQLEFRAQLIIDRPNYVFVDKKNEKVILNKIFDWYNSQFTSSGTLINYINQYKFYKVPKTYTVEYQDYDWSLNDRNP